MKKGILPLVFVFILTAVGSAGTAWAYRWPFADSAGPHPIKGTLGEFRPKTSNSSAHLHNGVDMNPSGGAQTGTNATKIYAIEGCAKPELLKDGTDLEAVRCGSFAYVHVNSTFKSGVTVTAGDAVAELKKLTYYSVHLHLTESGGGANPLRSGGLDNFTDTASPTVNSVSVVKQGSGDSFPDKISGKVDIKANAKDSLSGGGSQTVAPYKIGYKVADESGNLVVPETFHITFNTIYGYLYSLVYDTTASDESNYVYWVTNKPTENLYWDTAKHPNGKYTITVIAKDKDVGGNTATRELIVEVNNSPVVTSTSPSKGAYNVPLTSTVQISFDHEMDGATVQSAIGISPSIQGAYSWSADKKTVTLTPSQELTPDTTYTITISDAAKDTTGNQLDGDNNGQAGGNYVFTFSTKPAKINVLSLTTDYFDGSKIWVRAGSKTVTAQLVDDTGAPIASTTPPQLMWTSPAGGPQPVSFGGGGAATTTWTGTIAVSSGSDGAATFSGANNTPVSGITSFMIDTKPPKIESAPASSPTCKCPAGPISFKFNVTDEGSGVGTVTPIGLGLSASGCYDPGTYKYGASPVKDKVGNTTSQSGSLQVIQNKCVNPDDNYSVIIQNIPGPAASPVSIAGKKIAVLGNGYVYATQRFLADKVLSDSTIIDADFSPEMSEEFPLLIIPTGGLSGFVQSESFKARLASYAERGGTILAFSQNQGYEFEALPGGNVTGYGYSNDQQCFANAAYIRTWHQFLSGQSRANLDLNVDGFYTGLPDAGESILTRVSNGQSAMVVYPFGLGSVIATTMYTDWGYSVSQYTAQEISLIRDIVAWAKHPMELPEARPGEAVTVPTPLINQSPDDGASIRIVVRDPSKNIVAEMAGATALPAGQSAEISVPFATETTSPLGIWWINFEVLDAAGTVIQPEQEAARFAVATRPMNAAQKAGLSFSVLSDSENYLVGNNAEFTLMVFNTGTTERTVTAKYENQSQTVTVAPNSSAGMTYTKAITTISTRGSWLYAAFYDQNGSYLGNASKRYWSGWPSATATIRADKSDYAKGESVILSTAIENRSYSGWTADATVRITDPARTQIYEETRTLGLTPEGRTTDALRFDLPASALIGTYSVRYEVRSGTSLITSASTKFELPQSRITTVPDMPGAFAPGENAVPFLLTNVGTIPVSSGTLAVAVLDPAGTEIYSGSRSFALAAGESRAISMPVVLPALKKGSYQMTYSQSDETREGQQSVLYIPNGISVIPVFDRESYRIRETVNLSVKLNNTGQFNLDDITLSVAAPDAGYAESTSVGMAVGTGSTSGFAIPLPETLAAGRHTVTVTATLPSGDSWTTDAYFVVPQAELQLAVEKPSYTLGEQLVLSVDNRGGVDSDNAYTVKLYDSTRRLVQELAGSVLVQAGTTGQISFALPGTIVSDTYLLYVELHDGATNNRVVLQKNLEIDGISSSITVHTDKDIYISTDQKTASADIVVPSSTSSQGSLNLKALTMAPWFATATASGDAMIDTNVTRNLRNLSSGAEISNGYIDVVVNANGVLTIGTIGGDPDNPKDNYAKLLYGHPNPWSSFTTARIDNSDYKLGVSLTPIVRPYYAGSSIVAEWKVGNVRIRQTISIAYSDSGLPDTIQIEYDGKNEDSVAHAVGFRIMFDTQLGSNDGAPFQLPNVGNVTTEKDYVGSDVPLWLSMNSLTNPTVVGKGLLEGLGAVVPDRLVLARWASIYYTTWNYTINPYAAVTGDSAVGLWWNPQAVAPGGERKSKTFYGVGKVAAASAQLSTTLYAPNVLAFDPATEEPVFSVTAYVRNNTSQTASNVVATIQLPDGLVLEQDGTDKPLGSINAYQVAQATWRVRATGTSTGVLTYSVGATSTNLQGNTATTTISVPAWIGKDNSAGYVVWEEDVSVDTSLAQTVERQMAIPESVKGKLHLMGTLYAPSGQVLSQETKPFYIIEGNTALLMETDKKTYKPGETVTITGEARNLATVAEDSLTLTIDRQDQAGNRQAVFSETFGIEGSGSHGFSATIPADATGTFVLKGTVTKNGSSLVEIDEQYEVATPVVEASVSAPETAGNEPFTMTVDVRNTGKTTATVRVDASVDTQPREIDLLPGESGLIEYAARITQGTEFTFEFTGDLSQTITKTVAYGLAGGIAVESQTAAEGDVAVPVTVTNTGVLDGAFTVVYTLSPSGDAVTRTYYLPQGTTATDTLRYTLSEGVYQLSAASSSPPATAGAVITVKKQNHVDLSMSVEDQAGYLVPVSVLLSNLGFNDVAGSIRATVLDALGAPVWSSEQSIALPATGASSSADFEIDAEILAAGSYTISVELLTADGQQVAADSRSLAIRAPAIQITQLPGYRSFTAGQEATFVFTVRNTGDQSGSADLHVGAYDLMDANRALWLMPQEEQEITFSFLLPDDLEEKDYFVDYELSGSGPAAQGQVPYHVDGIDLTVTALLDKTSYVPGDTARLSLQVTQEPAQETGLVARVNYSGFEEQREFSLTGSTTLYFDIPLAEITGEKIFIGIYHASGRSIYLNTATINEAGRLILSSDKTLYDQGDTVNITVRSDDPLAVGTMVLSGPGGYEESFTFDGYAEKSMVLPSALIAGSYAVNCELETADGTAIQGGLSVEVKGIQVKITEASLDRGAYSSTDTVGASLTIVSNTVLAGTLKTWIVDPDGTYTPAGETPVELSSSQPTVVRAEASLATGLSGMHRLAYGVYLGDLLLASGTESFDVGNAMLLGLTTDREAYETGTEPVTVRASVYGMADAVLEIQLDGITVQASPVTLNGLATLSYELETVSGPGAHTLTAVLTSDGLSSTKETVFVYGSALPDLQISVFEIRESYVRKDNTVEVTATIVNNSDSPATETSVDMYDGTSLIGTGEVRSLAGGESDTITISWNVLGNAGDHTLRASVDPRGFVAEFNESNNDATATVHIASVAVLTETDKETYKIRQKVVMTAAVTNLSASVSQPNAILATSVKDPSGNEVYAKTVALGTLQPSATVTVADMWNTAGLGMEGIYTIQQSVFSGTDLLLQNAKLVTLAKAADFALTTDAQAIAVRQGGQAVVNAVLEPLFGWQQEVSLHMEGLPAGTSAAFTPAGAVPPFQSVVAVTTTAETPAGDYTLYVTAQGIDEGEIVTRAAELALTVSGYSLETAAPNRTVQQLDSAVFPITVAARNGYTGTVNLQVTGVPLGMWASFDQPQVQAPGHANLTVLTSKYAKPGVYTLSVEGDDGFARHTLSLGITLTANGDIAYGIIATKGPGPRNDAQVRIFDATGQLLREMSAFNSLYGAVATAADLDGDGYDELVVAQGPDPKNAAVLRAFRKDGTVFAEYLVDDSSYGLTIAAGDVDGDWTDELIVGLGPDPKNPGVVKIVEYTPQGLQEVAGRTVYPDAKNGVNVAAGDVDGDGKAEIITAPGPGPFNPAIVHALKYESGNLLEALSLTVADGTYGLNVATGDVDGDGKAEIAVATGADPNARAVVRIYKGGVLISEFAPYDQKHSYGAYISSGDLNADGVDEIVTGVGPGPQNEPLIKIFSPDGAEIGQFQAFPKGTSYGVRVHVGRSPR